MLITDKYNGIIIGVLFVLLLGLSVDLHNKWVDFNTELQRNSVYNNYTYLRDTIDDRIDPYIGIEVTNHNYLSFNETYFHEEPKLEYYNGSYPVLNMKSGTDTKRILRIVHSIKPECYRGIDNIEFLNIDNPDFYAQYQAFIYLSDDKDKIEKITMSKIKIYSSSYKLSDYGFHKVILHELGHNYATTQLKIPNDSENDADSFVC